MTFLARSMQALCGIALAASLLGTTGAGAACREVQFESARYAVCSFHPRQQRLELFWRNGDGTPFRTFSALANSLENEGGSLTFAINGGMFQTDFTPVGLHVENGAELRPLNLRDAPAGMRPVPNFYKKPNGVFYLTGEGAGILPADTYSRLSPDAIHATQSGPMLVVDGQLHPALIEGSRDRTWRTGVGVSDDGTVHFAISQRHVNFHDFARLFRDNLGSRDALFLDGGRGTGIYAPSLGRNDFSWHGGFGPIIGAVER